MLLSFESSLLSLLINTFLVGVSIVIALVLFLVVKFYVLTKIGINHYKKQGATCYYFPMIGHFPKMMQAVEEHGDFYYHSKKQARENPDRVMCTVLGSKPYVILHDTALIKEFFLNGDNYVKEPLTLDLFTYLLGEGLVMVEGAKWKSQKKMLSQRFHFEFLNSILPTIQNLAVEKFSNLKKGSLTDVDIMNTMQDISGEIVGKLFFGNELENYKFEGKRLTDALADIISEAFTAGQTSERYIFGLWLSKLIPKHKRMIQNINNFRSACAGFVRERKKVMAQNKGRNDMIQILLEGEGENVDEMFIVDQFLAFFLPGLDTSGHIMTMSLYYLTQYPECRAKFIEEVKRLYTCGKPITIEELNKFEYMSAFLKEVMRVSAPLGDVFARRAVKDHMLKDIHIRKGDTVNLDFFYNHFNPQHFPNPDVFDPNRWLTKEKTLDPYAFTPFSAGPRTCIGQHLAMNEIKIILSEFVNMFEFDIKEGFKLSMTLKFLYGPLDPILLNLKPIEK